MTEARQNAVRREIQKVIHNRPGCNINYINAQLTHMNISTIQVVWALSTLLMYDRIEQHGDEFWEVKE